MAFVQNFGVSRSPISYFYSTDDKTDVKPKVRVDPNSPRKGHDIINQNNNLALYGVYSGAGKTLNEVAARDSMALSRNSSHNSPLNKSWWSWGVDRFQDVLSVAGMIPGVGAIPDAVNAGISGVRAGYNELVGDDEARNEALVNLAFNSAAIIPGAGQAATAAKWARAGANASKGAKIASKGVKGLVKADLALKNNPVIKTLQGFGKLGKSTGKTSERVIKDTGKKLFNFGFHKKGLVPKALQTGIKNKLGNTAYLASKAVDKSTSAIGLGKFGKMGLLGEDVQKGIKSTYNDKYKKDNKDSGPFNEIPRGQMVTSPPKKSFEDAYENADKSKYKTFDEFKSAAVNYNKNKKLA